MHHGIMATALAIPDSQPTAVSYVVAIDVSREYFDLDETNLGAFDPRSSMPTRGAMVTVAAGPCQLRAHL